MNVNYQAVPAPNPGQQQPNVVYVNSAASNAGPRQIYVQHQSMPSAVPQGSGIVRYVVPADMAGRQVNQYGQQMVVQRTMPGNVQHRVIAPRVMMPTNAQNRAVMNKNGMIMTQQRMTGPPRHIRVVQAGNGNLVPQPGQKHIRPLYVHPSQNVAGANGRVQYVYHQGRPVPTQVQCVKVSPLLPMNGIAQPTASYVVRMPQQQQQSSDAQQQQPYSPHGSADSPSSITEGASPLSVNHVITMRNNVKLGIAICNVVCNYVLPMHIDLKLVARTLWNCRYQQDAAVLMLQHRNPECHAKISSSGKVYIVGCKSEEDSRKAARSIGRKIQKIMQRAHNQIPLKKYRISNILATCRLPFGVLIAEMARKYPKECEYEPELTVGLIYRSIEPKATLRIHTTGSVTVTGATSVADVYSVLESVHDKALEFKCDPSKVSNRPPARKRNTAEVNMGLGSIKRRRRNSDADDDVVGGGLMFEDEADLFDEDAVL
uniref:TATA box-binding protein-like 1 n=1 Tax=Panagrellus redivivus TaxID=6233 RepID=A0A7E4V0P6_PANRE